MKCLLSPKLNEFITHGQILVGSVVRITSHRLRYDESVVGRGPFCIIQGLDVLEKSGDPAPLAAAVCSLALSHLTSFLLLFYHITTTLSENRV